MRTVEVSGSLCVCSFMFMFMHIYVTDLNCTEYTRKQMELLPQQMFLKAQTWGKK